MAVTRKHLVQMGFTQSKEKSTLFMELGEYNITAYGSNIYMDGMHLINTDYIGPKLLKVYIDKVIQGATRKENGRS